jgi:hypothetical protein
MAQRGRKPKNDNRYYFLEREEQALLEYLKTDDEIIRNNIFNEILYPAYVKMVESIIRRYHLYIPDETFEELFDDTMSHLTAQLHKFDGTKGYKAYSYCGTVAKNYLLGKLQKFSKLQKLNSSYDETINEFTDNIKFSYGEDNHSEFLNELIQRTIKDIRKIIDDNQIKQNLQPNEIKVGNALIELFENWEDILDSAVNSNKFNKSSILFFLREATMLSTPEIRNNMKKYKTAYYFTKGKMLKN